jgi:acyl dehydratase
MTLYFEDLSKGSVYWGNECPVDREEMLAYAWQNDPSPFHVDDAAARATPFGGLTASGGYIITIWYRSVIPVLAPVAHIGALPDWHISFIQPVRPGDRLRAKATILGKRLSSRPERRRGYVTVAWDLLNQNKQVVLKVGVEWIVKRRD